MMEEVIRVTRTDLLILRKETNQMGLTASTDNMKYLLCSNKQSASPAIALLAILDLIS